MATVHPSAVLEGKVDLAENVEIGPGCVLRGPIAIGAGTRLLGNAWVQGPATLGRDNLIYPFACLGFAPQSVGIDTAKAGPGLVLGDGNTCRESVTIHRAMTDAGPTRIGNENYLMVASHVGHDCAVGSHCVLANGALLGGHVTLGDGVFVGGNCAVHQFCSIGRGAMLSGSMGISRDLPPFFMLTGNNVAGSVNLVGMRRRGMSSEEIGDVRWVYKTLYRRKLTAKQAREALLERADRPLVAEYIEFIERSTRGICPNRADPRRPR